MFLDDASSLKSGPEFRERSKDCFEANRITASIAQPELDRIDFYFAVAGQVRTAVDKPADRSPRLSTLSTYRPTVTGFTSRTPHTS